MGEGKFLLPTSYFLLPTSYFLLHAPRFTFHASRFTLLPLMQPQTKINTTAGDSDPAWTFFTLAAFANDIVDWAGLPFNITGIWVIISLGINLFTAFLFIGWKGKAILKDKKILLSILIEHIPVIGDIYPGWIVSAYLLRKK